MPRTRPVRSSASKLITTYTGFAGGFVSAKAVHELADDEFGGGQNVDLDRAGKASKRSGWKQMTAGSLAADGFKGAHEFRDNRGNALFFVAPYMTSSGMALYRLKDDESGWKPVRVALRGPVGVSAALAGGAGGAQFTASGHYLYAVAAESSNANYANSQPAEVAYIQQANPVEQITVTWRALRHAETYRVYRYNSARGWEKFDSLVTGTSLTDTGAYDWHKYPNIAPNYKRAAPAQWGLAQLRAKALRDFGASLGPEAAHHIAVGAETLALRMERTCANALALAQMLEADERVAAVHYPGLASHPQHAIAADLFRSFGSLFSFELKEGIDCFDYLNRMTIAVSASNLGDTRTLVIPVAHTIFFEMGAERRASMGIAESLIRVSVGIEDTADLLADFQGAL